MEKKSFIIYKDSLNVLDELSDEQVGRLFRAISEYSRTGAVTILDPIIKIAFVPIKNYIDRDYEAWIVKREKNIENGKKGGRPRNFEITQTNPDGFEITQTNPDEPVNVNANVNANVNVEIERKEEIEKIRNLRKEFFELKKAGKTPLTVAEYVNSKL